MFPVHNLFMCGIAGILTYRQTDAPVNRELWVTLTDYVLCPTGNLRVTQGVSVNGVHWRTPAWGFAWEAGWYEQGDLYDRVRVRLGLEHRF